ncbi:MAG: Integral rane protein, partial [Thermoleophilia bacterium]|nr:Integral rane protein [Thermoleophilia bacterium]
MRFARLIAGRPLVTVVVVLAIVASAATVGGRVPRELAKHGGDPFIDQSSPVARTNAALEHASHASASLGLIALVKLGDGGADRVDTVVARLREQRAEVAAVQAPLRASGELDPTSPLLSDDGRYALVTARIPTDVDLVAGGVRAHDMLGHIPGVKWGGASLVTSAINDQVEHDLRRAETIALPLLLIVSIFVFRSLIAGALPLLVGGSAMMLTFAALYGIDSWVTPVSNFALNLVIALALGLGVDYALLIVTRWREVRYDAGSARDASRTVLRLVAPTVASSAVSVAAAMGALYAFPQLFLRSMAIGGVVCALLAGAVALVLVPAALVLVGDRLDTLVPRRLRLVAGSVGGGRVWGSLARIVMRRPALVAGLTAAALLVVALPALHIRFGAVDATALGSSTEARQVDNALRNDFGRFTLAGMRVVVGTDAAGAVQLDTRTEIDRVARASGIAGTVQPPVPAGRGLALIEVPVTGDPQRPAARRLVTRLRAIDRDDVIGVTGESARVGDALNSLRSHAPWAAAIAATTTLVFVFLFTGSVVLPIKTIIMNALGAAAAFGTLVFVFQEGRLE